ncbi:glycine/sarcosine/betaine reductase component B subunit [Metaclostridioides mangenotii]|uniref:glycine/sarcosine/betaine reductase component B subunit n=1 Tax=Metaclostridioides mangenotii TaxID=1540 RepID=UPI0027D44B81|nr:glycine/sarcosine/betaine reductase component B subunit [Clostridioides mangenotii]
MGIGPSSKETTLHHFRDPLINKLYNDYDIDLMGVIVAGTPEVYDDKVFIAERIADIVNSFRVDGTIISIDSWGNSHIDFLTTIDRIRKKGCETVSLSFIGNQASFVLDIKDKGTIIDFNKNELGIETCVVGENTVGDLDALKAMEILKSKMKKRRNESIKYNILDIDSNSSRTIDKNLIIRSFNISEVKFGNETKIIKDTLYLNKSYEKKYIFDNEFIKSLDVSIINTCEHEINNNSIMDIIPIASKAHGNIGHGVTNLLTGVTVMLTGVEENGFQPSNIGSSEGILKNQIKLDQCGTPSKEDIIININVVLREGHGRTREGIIASNRLCDNIIQEVRDCLKSIDKNLCFKEEEYCSKNNLNSYKVLVVKLVPGLGCMYDTGVSPKEPGGFVGCRSVMNLGNMPIIISTNQYKDGFIKCMS